MQDIVSPLLEWLNANPQLAGLVTFIISAGESVAIIGTIVPGSITMTAIGALAGANVIPLWETILWAILGAVVGDGISYWIGYHFRDRLPRCWPFRTHPALLKTGEKFFHKHGSMSVFIGRFVGPVRALVPLVAGMLGMNPMKFLIANVASAIGWAPAYMLPGILLGAAALELPPDIAMHVIMVLLLLTLFFILCLWLLYKLMSLIHTQIEQAQNSMWHRLKESRYFSSLTILLKHHNHHKPHGQLNLAIYFILISLILAGLAMYVTYKGPAGIMINDALYHLFRGIRTDAADSIVISITLLGQKQVLLPVIIVLFGWLLYAKRWRVALHVLALAVLASAAVFFMKHMVQIPRPWGIPTMTERFSMPSGHTTLATTVFVGLAYLIALSFKPGRRWFAFFIGGLIAFSVGVSRLYLGAHWFTDVLAGWLLSMAVLIVIMISYERKHEKPVAAWPLLLITMVTFGLSFLFYEHQKGEQLIAQYKQMDWPTANIAMNPWWQQNNSMPAYTVSLFGFPSTPINIQWAGNLEQIKTALEKEGWSKPPARDWISTLHRIADISSTQFLPMVSPQYLDEAPQLILTRTINDQDQKKLLVLRLWSSNRIIKESNTSVWVGIVGLVPRSYSWLFKDRVETLPLDPVLVFPNKTASANWQWKIIKMNQATGTKKNLVQEILLIRSNKSNHRKR